MSLNNEQLIDTQAEWHACVFCFILFEVMWAWFLSLCRGLKRSCANSRIAPDVVLRFKISNRLFCFGLGLMD